MVCPLLSRIVPSLEGGSEKRFSSSLASQVLPSSASPALVERGVNMGIHPEGPERVICKRMEVEEGFSLGGHEAGLERCN